MGNRWCWALMIGMFMLLADSRAHHSAQYGRLPLSFEPNRGQFEHEFNFGSQGFSHSLRVNPTSLLLKFRNTSGTPARLEIKMVGANPSAKIQGDDRLPGEVNYFRGGPGEWITHVPTYGKVRVQDLYPGVDAVYYGNQSRLEYDFVVRPGASPRVIDIDFGPASRLALTDDGDLLINVENSQIRQLKPTVYQETRGARAPVSGNYVLRDSRHVGFEIGSYDHRLPLVIDPQLIYAIYGPALQRTYGIGVDSSGNAYICGTTPDGGSNDQATNAFAAKLNAAGTAFLWAANFGNFDFSDSATALAVDASANVYVTGWTGPMNSGPPPFPTTAGAIQPTSGGGSDAFMTKFDTNGNMLYSTYIGGSGDDRADGIAVDSLGNVYISGKTASPNFPVSKPFQSALHGSSDAFVTVLNPQGSAFIYSTYIGGSSDDAATAIAVDAAGNAFVTGTTSSADFPTSNPIQGTAAGKSDGFVLKLNPSGSALAYSTYLGGNGDDTPRGIAVDSSDGAYVTGTTNSTNFPIAAAYQAALHGGVDAFVTKINAAGTLLAYSTYLGGGSDETNGGIWCEEKPTCGGITVNGAGNAYVTGLTASPDFPQVKSLQGLKGITDAYIVEFSANGSTLLYSTLMGGSIGDDSPSSAFSSGSAVAYLNGNLYVGGLTDTTDFPVTANPTSGPCCVNPVWDGTVGFVAKLADDMLPPGGIALVQSSASEGSGVTSVSAAFQSANQAGNLIIAFVRMSTTTQTVSVTDSANNTYADAVSQAQTADGHQIHLFYAKNIHGGSNTVRATFSSANNHPWIAVYEYSGLDTNNPLDQTARAQGSNASAVAGPVTTTSSNELAIAATGLPASFKGTVNSGAGYSLQAQDTNTSRAANETGVLSAAGQTLGSFTLSFGTNWSAIVATFKAAGGSPPPPPPPPPPSPITQVQSTAVQGSAVSSVSASFASNNRGGDLIIAVVRMSTTTQSATVSDTAGNSYFQAAHVTQTSDGHQLFIFYAKSVAGLANRVTATFSGTNNHPWLAIFEYGGLNTQNPFDQAAGAQGAGSVADSGPTNTTAASTELVFAATGLPASYTGAALAGSGFALAQQDTSTSRAATETAITGSTGRFDGVFNLSPGTNWTAAVATFRQ